MSNPRAVILLLMPLVVSVGGATASPQGPLKKVVFAHRHCARTEIKDVDHGCGKVGCGMCTTQGELMLKATGESFRTRYGSVLPSEYLMANFKSICDTEQRTQQSASAFLKGLFAYNASYTVYPAINADGHDMVDPWSSSPTYKLRKGFNFGNAVPYIVPNITQFISVAAITAIAQELGQNMTECAWENGTFCLDRQADFAFSARSEGTLANYPVTASHWPELHALDLFRKPFFSSGWQHTVNRDGFFTEAGYPGHSLLLSMLYDAGHDDGVALHEYSGHDSTLMPLYAAMGNFTYVYPEFATSVVFEVYSNPSEASNPFVVVKTALPEQLPGTHPLTWFDYEVTCMNASTGDLYTSTTGCPLKDLTAFANTRSGTKAGPVGECYAFPHDLVWANCTDKTGAVPTRRACKDYRRSCPLAACGAGHYMKPDLSCNPV